MMRSDDALTHLRHEALQRARPPAEDLSDEQLAEFVEGTLEDARLDARLRGEIGTDPLITGLAMHRADLVDGGGRMVPGEVARTRLWWRLAWAAAAIFAVATTVGLVQKGTPLPATGRVELLDGELAESTVTPSTTHQRSMQDAIWMVLAWALLLGLTFPAWWPRSGEDSRGSD